MRIAFIVTFTIVFSLTYWYFIIYNNSFLQLNLTFLNIWSYKDFITWFIHVLSTQLCCHHYYIYSKCRLMNVKDFEKWEMFEGIEIKEACKCDFMVYCWKINEYDTHYICVKLLLLKGNSDRMYFYLMCGHWLDRCSGGLHGQA